MTDSMVERVARAMAAENYDDAVREWGAEDVRPKAEYIEARWRTIIPLARAAIAAMREPTNKMLESAGTMRGFDENILHTGVGEHEYMGPDHAHIEWWQAMHDAALGEDDG